LVSDLLSMTAAKALRLSIMMLNSHAKYHSVLRASASRDEIAIVDAAGFAMQLDICLIHLREFGNLRRAIERLTAMVVDGFARYAAV
jgi:hypothetical protein